MRRWPAEWETQKSVYLGFPREDGDWGVALRAACSAIVKAANAIHRVCPVTLIVSDRELFAEYHRDFAGRVSFLPADDVWLRDSGPITIIENGAAVLLDFIFNGWGGKYEASLDNLLPAAIHRTDYPTYGYRKLPYILEGGAIETDGAGTVMTTTRCLLSEGRNDFTTRDEAEAMLGVTLGAQRFIWLDHGELAGDDTDAHIDTIARFIDRRTIAYVGPPPDPGNRHSADFAAMRSQLRQQAADYRLLELPWAGDHYSPVDRHQLPATYANFLISNGHLFLPVYGTPADRVATDLLRRETDYTVVPVDARALIEQHGSLHCLTMQIPAV